VRLIGRRAGRAGVDRRAQQKKLMIVSWFTDWPSERSYE
jgi:hypothetical protein